MVILVCSCTECSSVLLGHLLPRYNLVFYIPVELVTFMFNNVEFNKFVSFSSAKAVLSVCLSTIWYSVMCNLHE